MSPLPLAPCPMISLCFRYTFALCVSRVFHVYPTCAKHVPCVSHAQHTTCTNTTHSFDCPVDSGVGAGGRDVFLTLKEGSGELHLQLQGEFSPDLASETPLKPATLEGHNSPPARLESVS